MVATAVAAVAAAVIPRQRRPFAASTEPLVDGGFFLGALLTRLGEPRLGQFPQFFVGVLRTAHGVQYDAQFLPAGFANCEKAVTKW